MSSVCTVLCYKDWGLHATSSVYVSLAAQQLMQEIDAWEATQLRNESWDELTHAICPTTSNIKHQSSKYRIA